MSASNPAPGWSRESTAQAFAWLDHCIERQIDFRSTIKTHLGETTDMKLSGLKFISISKHMTAYAQSLNLNNPYNNVKKKLKSADHRRFMDDLLVRGTTMVPILTGNTPIAELIAENKGVLSGASIAPNIGPVEAREEEDRDEIVANENDKDNDSSEYEADEDISAHESSQSEYMGNNFRRLGTVPHTGKKRYRQLHESSQVQLPPSKRARIGPSSTQSTTDKQDDSNDGDSMEDSSQSEYMNGGDSVEDSSHSEYMDDGPKRSGPGLIAAQKRRRQQSTPAQLPPAKRARISAQSTELLTDEKEELHDEMPSKESFTTRIFRRFYPSKASEKRQAHAQDEEQKDEQEQRRRCSAPMTVPTAYKGPQTPVVSQPEPPEISPLTSSSHTSQQDENPQIRPAVVPETPQGDATIYLTQDNPQHHAQHPKQAFDDTEPRQESPLASTSFTAAPRSGGQQTKTDYDSNQHQGFLARENARLQKLIFQKDAEIDVWKQQTHSVLSTLSAPGNTDKKLREEYDDMCHRYNSQERFQTRKHDVTQDFIGHQPSDLARKFDILHNEIYQACADFALADSNQTLTMSSPEDGVGTTLRDPKILSLLETACGSSLQAWKLRMYEDSPTDLVRALVTAHIFRRIFESDFPMLYTGARDSPLLTQYQNLWYDQDGAKELWLAERVALKEFVKSRSVAYRNESFQEFIDNKANEFANEIAILLAPLTTPCNILAEMLISVYATALRLKVDTVVSNYTFKARFVRPGLDFESEMEKGVEVEHSYSNPDSFDQGIKLSMFPIIYFKPVPEIDPLTAKVRDCLVDYKNFKVCTELLWDDKVKDHSILHKGLVFV